MLGNLRHILSHDPSKYPVRGDEPRRMGFLVSVAKENDERNVGYRESTEDSGRVDLYGHQWAPIKMPPPYLASAIQVSRTIIMIIQCAIKHKARDT